MSYRTNVAPSCSSWIYGNDDATLEAESKCGSSVLDLDSAAGISMVVGVKAEEWCRLDVHQKSVTTRQLIAGLWSRNSRLGR